MANPNLDDDIAKYEHHINATLKKDLDKLEAELTKVNAELSDLIQQKQTLKVVADKKVHPNGFKSQVNLGCNFFMEATVPDTSTMLVNIGLNYWLEFTVTEANKYLDKMITTYEAKAEEIRSKVSTINAHIKLTLIHIDVLQNKKTKV